MDEDLKEFSKYKIEKMKTDLYFRNTNQNHRSECMQCCSIEQKEWRDKNHEKLIIRKKQLYEDNRAKIRNQQKKYYVENRDVIIKNQIKYEKIEEKEMSTFD